VNTEAVTAQVNLSLSDQINISVADITEPIKSEKEEESRKISPLEIDVKEKLKQQ